MDTLDHDYTLHTRQGAGDEKLFVTFYKHWTLDEVKTAEEGRPVHQDATFVRIVTPGDRDNIVDRVVRESDQFRFQKQWERFKAGEADIGTGTRLEEWTMMPRSIVEDLRYFGFRTVEHVAEAHEGALSKMPGLREWQNRAKLFLAAAKDASAVSQKDAENRALKAEIDALRAQVEDLAKLARVADGAVAVPAGKK